MPITYLSPSTQELNSYIGGGNEEYYTNLIADEMIPYLNSSGIKYARNNPNQSISDAITRSNKDNYDLHLAIRSATESETNSGKSRGTNVYYIPGDPNSYRLAKILLDNFKEISPISDKVRIIPTTFITELKDTNAPATLVEIAYHDNPEDAMWIRENIEKIAETFVKSLTEYFGIPFITPQTIKHAKTTHEINLTLRPSADSAVITYIPSNSNILILGGWQNWYVVDHLGNVGYAKKSDIDN